jgi:hypothetical protein
MKLLEAKRPTRHNEFQVASPNVPSFTLPQMEARFPYASFKHHAMNGGIAPSILSPDTRQWSDSLSDRNSHGARMGLEEAGIEARFPCIVAFKILVA